MSVEPIELCLRPGGASSLRQRVQLPVVDDEAYDLLEAREIRGMRGLSLYEQIVKQCGENVFQLHVRGKDGEFVPVPYHHTFEDDERDYLSEHGAEFGAPEMDPIFPHRPLYRGSTFENLGPIGETFDVPIPVPAVTPAREDLADKGPDFFQVDGADLTLSEAELALQVPDLVGTTRLAAINETPACVKCDFTNGSLNVQLEASPTHPPTDRMYSALEMLEGVGVNLDPLRKQFDEVIISALLVRYDFDVASGVLVSRIRQVGSDVDPLWRVAAGPLVTLLSHVVAKSEGRPVAHSALWTLSQALRDVHFSIRDLRACIEATMMLSHYPQVTLVRVHTPQPGVYVRHSARVLSGLLEVLPRIKRQSVAYIPRSARDFEAVLVLCAAYGVPVERRVSPDCARPIICAVGGEASSRVDRLGLIAFSRLLSLEIIDGSFTQRFMPLYRYVRPREVVLGQYIRLHFTRTRFVVACMVTVQKSVDGVVRVVFSPERRKPDKYLPYVKLVCAYLRGNAPAPVQWSYYAMYRGPDPKLIMYPVLVAFADDFVSSDGVDSEAAPESGQPIKNFTACDLCGRRPVPLPAIIALAHV